ncbi:MAG: PA2779 family protein [Thermodesulfovibrionales bacterium]|nr:PA2779 family protein [Thermodesulfovibrionales bacterium]MDP3110795.1 PA2779 family protein [Thermodesulfovibrionales bacterium]
MSMPLMRHISWYLIIAMFIIGITPKADAGLAPSALIAMSQTDRFADLEKIQKVIEMKMVSERLDKLGLAQDEIQARLGSLSDQQLHKLALQIDDIKVGGDVLGVIIALLVIAVLVVVLLQLTGQRVIVTK